MAAGTAPTRCCWPGRWLPKKAKGKGQTQAKVNISAALVEDIINLEETNTDMQAVVEALKEDFNRNLNVRTSQGALDHIIVTTKDGKFPLNQLGQISQKSPQLIVVNMTSFPESTAAAMKAIRESGMNLNPEVDGTLIRVPVPKSKADLPFPREICLMSCHSSAAELLLLSVPFPWQLAPRSPTSNSFAVCTTCPAGLPLMGSSPVGQQNCSGFRPLQTRRTVSIFKTF
ncbi:ribosome-recycling factor, mitochondrial isoform X3 [Gallus gallus]|uniref:ribosome-recycling factor, mitochondrial isoform X3 n=1 Tax=Gallus gallus TaxID=9031 RepID=UPI001AE41728|nr:ribosome-recycling factor, mitochondrial isoform X3 [Gallus gallus]XP_046784862.1 ribosome-recycling factor, mitochondrial isoform X3 [Gallus gallus]